MEGQGEGRYRLGVELFYLFLREMALGVYQRKV